MTALGGVHQFERLYLMLKDVWKAKEPSFLRLYLPNILSRTFLVLAPKEFFKELKMALVVVEFVDSFGFHELAEREMRSLDVA